ncbi:glycosyltransferase family 4 protein [Tautonia plasticadhaerens]|uniref:2-deoxystreptamine glucosyltransferase n=1 Tax=Tautonia plasticadhaerens TaxID=2527974 RepID=A0A518GYZ9_9BACT|nr:glycosyltransferase family 4 protein [Tautonia plasticadhaerens]QDV33828.1 2-deoxystreptamine glucosyltransferase [Tautonia plasticadhaerens]
MAEAPITVALLGGHPSRTGEARRLARLVDRLASRGVSARVVLPGGGTELREHGVDPLEEPWLARPWLARASARRLPMADPDFRPDLVHALHDEAAGAAAVLARLRDLPLIRTVEDDAGLDGPSRLDPRGLAAVVACDARMAALLDARDRAIGRLVRVIPPGFDPPADPGPADGSPPVGRVPVIGAMGRLGPGSGFETFLDAVHRVVETGRDVEFLVVGLGPGESRVRRRADRLGIADRLTFAGPSTLEDAFWGVVDVYHQPSAVPSCGRHLMAAMAAGRPCVAPDLDGLRQLLSPGDLGLLVPPGDPAALARALLSMLDRPLLARSLADRARAWACTHLDPDREADALASLYGAVARTSPPPATRRS